MLLRTPVNSIRFRFKGFRMMLGFAYLICVFVGLFVFRWLRKRLPGIPGPYGLPIVGYMPFLGRRMNETLTQLVGKYGPVYQVQLGSCTTVVVNGQKAIRAALTGPRGQDFAGRPDFMSYEGFGEFGAKGYTPAFKFYKKLTLKAMALFANVKKDELQDAGYRAIDMFIDDVKARNGQPFDPKMLLYDVVWTIMGYICYGRNFNREDPEVREILKLGDEFGRTVMFGVICDYLPWAKFLMKKQLAINKILLDKIGSQSKKLAEENVKNWDGKSLRNISDMFRKADEDLSPDEKASFDMGDETLLNLLTNIFGAGFGTVAVTTKWALLYLGRYPEIQDRVQAELDSVIGPGILPTFEDQSNLPFCSAVITEIYRASSMASLGITHATVRDTELCGMPIPAETPVVFNLYSAHYDPDVFPNPHQFDPERFLKDGQLDKAKAEQVMPYGIGLRRCGGENLAKLEIFLFFCGIFQKCRIIPGPGENLDPKNYRFGLGLDPEPFKVSFEPRHNSW